MQATPTIPTKSDQASKPRMTPAELEEMCICAAATAVVSYALGYGYEDITVDDDGHGWPTTSSCVDTGYWPIGDDPGPTGNGEPSPDVDRFPSACALPLAARTSPARGSSGLKSASTTSPGVCASRLAAPRGKRS